MIACRETTATSDDTRVYRLLSVNGSPLPVVVPPYVSGAVSAQLVNETVYLGPDSLATAVTERRTESGELQRDSLGFLIRDAGRDTVRLQFRCPIGARCAIADRLVMFSGGATVRMRVLTSDSTTLDFVQIR